jgi:hypothetical protein
MLQRAQLLSAAGHIPGRSAGGDVNARSNCNGDGDFSRTLTQAEGALNALSGSHLTHKAASF